MSDLSDNDLKGAIIKETMNKQGNATDLWKLSVENIYERKHHDLTFKKFTT